MTGQYESFTMIWVGHTIKVSHQANWLRSGHWHIELRCPERLPVTVTGYRSIFVPEAEISTDMDIEEFVTELLDEAATGKTWLRYIEDSRQLKLF